MIVSTTPQTLIDDILASTDEDGYGRISSAQLCAWINRELGAAWQLIRSCNRDALTKVTSQFSVTSTGNISMTAAAPTGVAVTDWGIPRAVDALIGTDTWKKLRRYNFVTRDRVGDISYKFMVDTLYILPTDQATTYPLRVWYTYAAPTVSSAALATAFNIIEGVDDYVIEMVAARVRGRLDDDPQLHLALRKEAERDLKAMLATSKGDQSIIADVSGETDPEAW